MKANELRIGNYLQNFAGDIAQVIHLTKDKTILESAIPLTEEWLLKFEFVKVSTNYERDWLLLWGNIKTGTIDFVLNEPHSYKRHITPLKYVHQLQNLYFALTGEELTIR
jgi:hypothetical protein